MDRGTSAKILGSVVFWVVLLFFLTAATQVLGLHAFAAWLARVADYLPTVFAGILIIVAGFLVSRLAREVAEAAAASASERQRALIGRLVQASILVTAILVGAEQIGIKVTFFVILVAAAGISLVGAVALSLLTTVTDVVGFFSFLGIATLFSSLLWNRLECIPRQFIEPLTQPETVLRFTLSVVPAPVWLAPLKCGIFAMPWPRL